MPYGQQQGPVAICCSAGGQRRAQTSKLHQVHPSGSSRQVQSANAAGRQAGRQAAGRQAGRQQAGRQEAGRQAGTQTGVQRTQREDTKTK